MQVARREMFWGSKDCKLGKSWWISQFAFRTWLLGWLYHSNKGKSWVTVSCQRALEAKQGPWNQIEYSIQKNRWQTWAMSCELYIVTINSQAICSWRVGQWDCSEVVSIELSCWRKICQSRWAHSPLLAWLKLEWQLQLGMILQAEYKA